MTRLAVIGRVRRIQMVSLLASVALLSLVVWSAITSGSPAPSTVSGTWVGIGTVYDSTAGGLNHIAMLLHLTENDEGRITGNAQDCNDQGQRDAFDVSGLVSGPTVTVAISGASLRGVESPNGIALSGTANGVTMQLDLRKGNSAEFESSCAALAPPYTPSVP